MPKLDEILSSEQNRQFIMEQADFYGFKNVRGYVDEAGTGILYFLVAEKEEENYENALSAVLSDKFQCTIGTLVDGELNELVAPSIMENSFDILNYESQAIEAKLNKKINEILIEPLNDPVDKMTVQEGLELAEIIKARRKTSPQLNEEETSKKRKAEFEERKEKFAAEMENPKNSKLLHKLLLALTEDEFSALEIKYEAIKSHENSDSFEFFKKPLTP